MNAPDRPQTADQQTAWQVLLDGIHHPERPGYAYFRAENRLQELTSLADRSPSGGLNLPIQTADIPIGALALFAEEGETWLPEDEKVAQAVTQALASHLESLRLLEVAQLARTETEEALLHLTSRWNWLLTPGGKPPTPTSLRAEVYPSPIATQTIGFSYDGQQVSSLQADPLSRLQWTSTADELNLPLALPDRAQGSLQLLSAADHFWTQDELAVATRIAERCLRQIENISLLDEAHYYRQATEQTVRQLTSETWKTYLQGGDYPSGAAAFTYEAGRKVAHTTESVDLPSQFPIQVRGAQVGEIGINLPALDEDQASLLQVITTQLSEHLETLRLNEQRELSLSESEALYAISARLSTAQSLEDALCSLSEPTSVRGSNSSRLFLVNYDDKGQAESISLAAFWYAKEGAQSVQASITFPLSDYPVYAWCMQFSDRLLLIENVATDPRLNDEMRSAFQRSGAEALAMMPLVIHGRWVGMTFVHWLQPRVFRGTEKRVYLSLANQAAVVINNLILLEQTRRRAQELHTVAQVSTAASTILDPQELLQSVVELTKSSFSLHHVQVYLYRAEQAYLEAAAQAPAANPQNTLDSTRYEMLDGDSAIARAARERQVIILNDLSAENTPIAGARSEIAMPMVIGERLLGVFDALSETNNRFSREDARIFSTLASQIAVALQNAQLYAEQSVTMARLRELDHLKSAFLANMSHELRTPLNSILGFSDVLLLGIDGPLNAVMQNDVKLIEKNGQHLLSLINDVLDMAKIEAGRMNLTFEHFCFTDLLQDALEITSSQAREKALDVQLHCPEDAQALEIIADRVRIRQVVINLLSNAVKFTPYRGAITLTVQPAGDKVRLMVQDTGIGVPADQLDVIFEEFSQVDTSTTRKVGGTGLGLPISRKLVEIHGGRLWAESSGIAGEGTTLIMELPTRAENAKESA